MSAAGLVTSLFLGVEKHLGRSFCFLHPLLRQQVPGGFGKYRMVFPLIFSSLAADFAGSVTPTLLLSAS